MGLQTSDHFPISRAGTLYKVTGSDIIALIQANVGTGEYEVANIAARNALTGVSLGDRVFVVDATGDATVSSGWAIYVWRGAAWTKVAEEEGLDVVVGGCNLTYTAGASNGIVVSSNGTDATLPAADGTNAGLMVPAQFSKLGFIAVTQGVDLDAMESASHAAVTTGGSASTNPIVVTGQALTFSIANLTTAP
ncbi:hypothetical protein [Novosphingobium sp.]|uniref:hypothetical protein n=1 Tax=Novosphingobium sp. TaxID=1874826 RepID=UPI00286D801D|nr:hypothetical protein [Novosphingobium sp.]